MRPVKLNGKEFDLDDIAMYMDDELREQLHMELAPCNPQKFLDEYCRRHFEKFGEEFDVN